MISKIYQIICDNCKCGIDHWEGDSKKQAEQIAKQYGAIVRNGKHFCGTGCQSEFNTTESSPPKAKEHSGD